MGYSPGMDPRRLRITIALLCGVLFGATIALVAGGQPDDAVAPGSSGAGAADDAPPIESISASGDAGGLWVMLRDAEGRLRLRHRTADQPDHVLRPAVEETATLEAFAGGGERGYLIYDDGTVQAIQRRTDPRRERSEYQRNQFPPLPGIETVVDAASVGGRLYVLVDMGPTEPPSTDAADDGADAVDEAEAVDAAGGDATDEASADAEGPAGVSGEAAAGADASAADTSAVDESDDGDRESSDAGDGAAAPDDAEGGARRGLWLIETSGSGWRWTALPAAATRDALLRLAAGGSGRPAVVVQPDTARAGEADAARVTVLELRGEQWRTMRFDHELVEGWQAVRVMGEVVTVEPTGDARQLAVTVYVDAAARDGGRLELPEGKLVGWSATAYGDRVSVIAANAAGKLWLADRSLTAKPDAEPALHALTVEAEPAPPFNEQFVFYGLLALAVISVMAVRRMDRSEVAVDLPEGMMPAPMGRRFVALVIDMAPSVVVMMAALGIGDPVSLLMPWLALSSDLVALAPAGGVIVLTAVHGAIAEMFIGGSIGKRLVGLHTVSVKGEAIGARPAIVRNLMKMIELLLWPLALFALLNDPHQRMGDLVGRTVVVVRIAPGDEPQTEERSEAEASEDEAESDEGSSEQR